MKNFLIVLVIGFLSQNLSAGRKVLEEVKECKEFWDEYIDEAQEAYNEQCDDIRVLFWVSDSEKKKMFEKRDKLKVLFDRLKDARGNCYADGLKQSQINYSFLL